VPGQTAAFATISFADTGRASALANALRQLGAALGVAMLGQVLSVVGPTRQSATGTVVPNLTAYHAAFLAAALFALVAAGIALAISDRDAAPTMKPQVKQIRHEEAPEQTLQAQARS
jgi:hypothetical protein